VKSLVCVTCRTFAVLVICLSCLPVRSFGQTPSAFTPQGVPIYSAPNTYPNPNPGVIPETAPINRDQAQWTKDRNQCVQYFARIQMSPSQLAGLPPVSRTQLLNCQDMIAAPVRVAPAPAGTPAGIMAPLVIPTPEPAVSGDFSPAVAPLTSLGSTSPLPPFAGADQKACGVIPEQPPQPNVNEGEPPNEAADVSRTENAQFSNNVGLYVYNKSGTLIAPGSGWSNPETDYTFWCGPGHNGANGQPLPGCSTYGSTTSLSDTDIAYDPAAHRWMLTEMETQIGLPVAIGVYFAISNQDDATDQPGYWSRYYLGSTCPANYPYLDQPILGYSSSWVAINTACFSYSQTQGATEGMDTVTLIPTSYLTSPPQTMAPPIYAVGPDNHMRPSRDVSASGYPYLYLVGTYLPMTGAGAQPVIDFLTVDSDAVFNLAATTTLNVAAGTYMLPVGSQLGCSTYGCEINAEDARIDHVVLQQGIDGNHYLAAAFATGWGSAGSQIAFFVQQAENPSNIVLIGTQTDEYTLAFPTIAMDPQFNTQMAFTIFSPTAYPWVDWNFFNMRTNAEAGVGAFLSDGVLVGSANTYQGEENCGNASGLQRWGDYNTTVWDANAPSPSGKPDSFWNVVEYSNGTTDPQNTQYGLDDESSDWFQMGDPLPWFISSARNSTSCADGGTCSVTVSAPAGVQPGDVLIAQLNLGRNTVVLPGANGWTFLPLSSINNQTVTDTYTLQGSIPCGVWDSGWLAAHTYAAGESQYTFTHPSLYYDACGAQWYPRLEAYLVAYRDADYTQPNFSNYLVNGYATNTQAVSIPFGPMSLLGQGTLIDSLVDAPVPENSISLGPASPTLTFESTAQDDASGHFDLDAGIPSAVTTGSYTASYTDYSKCPAGYICTWLDWMAYLPEL
jgi:hypothetical protein